MREIKFRGKNLYDVIVRQEDGDDFTEIKAGRMWLYGGYAEIDGKGYLFPEAKCHQANGDYWMDDDAPDIPIVDKETVGQYTGLTDKNGKEIYEGDIFKRDPHMMASDSPYCVRYKHGSWIGVDANSGWLTLIEEAEEPYRDDLFYIEVIGNIHDNPELLKED